MAKFPVYLMVGLASVIALVSSSSPDIETIIHPIHFNVEHPKYLEQEPESYHLLDSNATTFVDYYWDARNFPANVNTTDRSICRMGSIPNEHNSVCNPDQLITDANARSLNTKIQEIRRGAPCQCGNQCGSNKLTGHFNIGIAIAKNLVTENAFINHCASDRCRVFAQQLRAVRWFNWLQTCDDGMVIGLSDGNGQAGQGAVFTSTGPKARTRISNDCVDDIFRQVSGNCSQRNYYECLDNMLDFYRNALHGGACGKRSGGTALTAGEIVGIVFGVIFGIALIVGLVILIMRCCRDE